MTQCPAQRGARKHGYKKKHNEVEQVLGTIRKPVDFFLEEYIIYFFVVLAMETRALCMLGTHSTIDWTTPPASHWGILGR